MTGGIPSAQGLMPAVVGDYETAFIYVVEFQDGTVKVGRSSCPTARVAQLCRKYRRTARRGHAALNVGSAAHLTERDVLARCVRIGAKAADGAELFSGLRFGEAVNLVNQIAYRLDVCAHIKTHGAAT